ncbi:MAG: gamma-glutamylcyclotransferase [Gammaproteobacteria bacterium]|nr:gamma-glutamylcyclotransferase [Gammaproteobacteria bacterium]
MYPVFVFGTLKQGFPNSSKNNGSRVPGEFLTKGRYPLYLVGERHSPWLVLSRGEGFQVRGQVFMVDDATLSFMDRLERTHEADGYHRVQMPVISESTNEEMQVFVYGKPAEQLEGMRVQLGPIAVYELEHSSLYRKRNP